MRQAFAFGPGFSHTGDHMTALTADQVRHIAKLARLQLTDAEVDRFAKEMTSILQYVDMLSEVDTKDVTPTSQVTGLSNAFRDDTVAEAIVTGDALLACTPLPIADHQIQTRSAH